MMNGKRDPAHRYWGYWEGSGQHGTHPSLEGSSERGVAHRQKKWLGQRPGPPEQEMAPLLAKLRKRGNSRKEISDESRAATGG
jgi:hypothetical protein